MSVMKPTADEVIARTAGRYATCRTYLDESRTETVFVHGATSSIPKHTRRMTARTAYVRPDLFLFEFRSPIGPLENEPEAEWARFVAWRAGAETRSWWTIRPQIETRERVFDALGAAAGISGSVSLSVPSLLFPGEGCRSPLFPPGTSDVVASEAVGGRPCHRLERRETGDDRFVQWIGVEDHLLYRFQVRREFTAKKLEHLHAESRRALEQRLSKGGVTAEQERRLREAESSMVVEEFVSEQTTTYVPVVDADVPADAFAIEIPAS